MKDNTFFSKADNSSQQSQFLANEVLVKPELSGFFNYFKDLNLLSPLISEPNKLHLYNQISVDIITCSKYAKIQ